MFRRKITSFIFVTLCLAGHISAQSQSRQTAATPAGTATVSGVVMLKGSAVRGVTVALTPMLASGSWDQSAARRTRTDDGGRFQFTGLPAGRYVVGALAPGYVSPSDYSFGPLGKNLNLSDGENVENLELELKRGGVITGKVTDSNGNPATEEYVSLMKLNEQGKPQPYSHPAGVFGFSTDDRGVYRVFGLPAGRYLVSVGFTQRENSIMLTTRRAFYAQTFHPDTTNESKAKVVEVSEGFEATGIDIATEGVKKTYDIFGRVFDAESGQGVAGLQLGFGVVSQGSNNIGPWGAGGQRTNSQGEFHMPGILPGKYAVFAQTEYDSEFHSEPVMIEIADGDVTGVEIKLRRGASINGVAVIEGVNDPAVTSKLSQLQLGFTIASDSLTAPRGGNVKINPDGKFRVNGMKPGKVTVSTYGPAARGFSILRIERDGGSLGNVIEIAPGDRTINARLVLGYGAAAIRGQVKFAGGSPPPDITFTVYAQKLDDGRRIGSGGGLDARGQFLIEGMMPGEYELRLRVNSRTFGGEVPPLIRARAESFSQRISVGAGETQAVIAFDLSQKEGNQ